MSLLTNIYYNYNYDNNCDLKYDCIHYDHYENEEK